MATRTEDRLGVSKGVGTTYTNVATVAASTTWNLILHAVNKTTGQVKFRAFVADNSWSSGEPTGGTLQYSVCYDLPIDPGQALQITGVVALATEILGVRCDTASAVDV